MQNNLRRDRARNAMLFLPLSAFLPFCSPTNLFCAETFNFYILIKAMFVMQTLKLRLLILSRRTPFDTVCLN